MTSDEKEIRAAIRILNEHSDKETDGKWLEELVTKYISHIRELDIDRCYSWENWSGREKHEFAKRDVGIDAVAIRLSDGKNIAIQCKSRKLDENGHGNDITKKEIDSFASVSAGPSWAERWVVSNGYAKLGDNANSIQAISGKEIKSFNLTHLFKNQLGRFQQDKECPHCSENHASQTKTCMQNEAVSSSVRILEEHEQSTSGGKPKGQARGRITLPCGTGKTRISLRIVEELTSKGQLSVILCPSIALVAQIRREYLSHRSEKIRALAVCSDETAGYNAKNEDKVVDTTQDPTADNSNISATDVPGFVTTDSSEIAGWIEGGKKSSGINVIFGTYQSSDKVADALKVAKTKVCVLVADEAHRTASIQKLTDHKRIDKIRRFTLCHDSDKFPATYRVYQTATPRIFEPPKSRNGLNGLVVRGMENEEVFGVDLYRKSYIEAVKNHWLSDYRIIALGVNDPEAYDIVNKLASDNGERKSLTTVDYLNGLVFALVMGGATQSDDEKVTIKSCIAFMNTVAKSKGMAKVLETDIVKGWVQKWLNNNAQGRMVADYKLEHLDAKSNMGKRDSAKQRLADASEETPRGIINVGIFGEGTDSPSLSAVSFLEKRKSPIDVIQAVGRVMRTTQDKDIGYIICPIRIPPNVDPEQWLSTSNMEDGWQELGQILMALRSHDSRIENNLSSLLQIYLPAEPIKEENSVVAMVIDEKIQYYTHTGLPDKAPEAIERVIKGKSSPEKEFEIITENSKLEIDKSESIYTGKETSDGKIEIRTNTVGRHKASSDGTRGDVDFEKTKKIAKKMINEGEGNIYKPRRTAEEVAEREATYMLRQIKLDEYGDAISMNLLSKSGLIHDRVDRDLNILKSAIGEASHHLSIDGLSTVLDGHFNLNNLDETARQKQADGCTIAALLIMNAAMLHQRIGNGGWLPGIDDLSAIKSDTRVVQEIKRSWNKIMRHDFLPILEPAVEVIEEIERTGKLGGLERALRHIAAEAERIAETYADMGADHAGPLFNKVMGNQASDGAFFTRPTAASMAARLTLDACGDVDWSDEQVWRDHKTVDLACGSGTLLTAILTDMKRRAKGADTSKLQKLAVEETIKGLDINPVSLQLAASQLTTGNHEIRYRKMGLHRMPYGPSRYDSKHVSAGTLELFGQKEILPVPNAFEGSDDVIASQAVWNQDAELEDPTESVKDARIIIMNPPFTNRAKMGEKFPKDTQDRLRKRKDALEKILTLTDSELGIFIDKNSTAPSFVALADLCLNQETGILAMINPTITLSTTAAQQKRCLIAQRYYIHTIITCHQPGQINMSQNTAINESIIIAKRHGGAKPPTRFINLDKMPLNEDEVEDLHRCISECPRGTMANNWGEVSEWPAEHMNSGDWTPGIWRSPELAKAARFYANHEDLQSMKETTSMSVNLTDPILRGSFKATDPKTSGKIQVHATGRVLRGSFKSTDSKTPGSFPILKSKGGDAQKCIKSTPDEYWIPKEPDDKSQTDKILQKAGYLLITAGQDTSTARLTATAGDDKYVGNSWQPVTGVSVEEAKALSVFINSTPGRLQLMRKPGKKITFPTYSAAEANNMKIPNIKDDYIRQTLAKCWEETKDMEVPQFRDGECEVRSLWDNAVAKGMGWDPDEITRLRKFLNKEPHVRGLGYNQYAEGSDKRLCIMSQSGLK